jgi:hypothetical protein
MNRNLQLAAAGNLGGDGHAGGEEDQTIEEEDIEGEKIT